MLAPNAVVRPQLVDAHGHRYTADMVVMGANGRQAVVPTGWIVRTELVTRLPEPVGGEVLDFVRFLSVRSNQQSRNQGTHVLMAEDLERYRT